MIFREETEKEEFQRLSKYAKKAAETLVREKEEKKCLFRTEFQRDRDRIIHSKALRRLMHKTQVFIAPEEDHFRTRLTHTMEVSQISRTIARALGLNEDLTEAIALGHDLGHTPFGHSGERILNEIHPGGFRHNEQSLRVVEVLEKTPSGNLMNLTKEVRDGILNHTGSGIPMTLEGQVVKISDRIAYINHDIDDAILAGVIRLEELPKEGLEILGQTHSVRINTLVTDMVENSDGKPRIHMSEERILAMNQLRNFMFQNVYHSHTVVGEEQRREIRDIICGLYEYYQKNPEKLPEERQGMLEKWGTDEVVKDHIASMTDRYAARMYQQIKGVTTQIFGKNI